MTTQNDVCPICLDEKSENGEELRKLHPCNHAVHVTCMSKWINEGTRICPLCREKTCGLINDPFRFSPTDRVPVHTMLFLVDHLVTVSNDLKCLDGWAKSLTFGRITQFNIFCLLCVASNPFILYFCLYFKSLQDVCRGNPGMGRLCYSFPVSRGQSLEMRLNGLVDLIRYFDQFQLALHPNSSHVITHRNYAVTNLCRILEEYSEYQTHHLTIFLADFLNHPATLIVSVFFVSAFVASILLKCINYIFI